MTIKNSYPAIRPSLNLDFANAKVLDPRITFSRASAATYYDGKTVAKAEENLLTYSQQITAGVGAWAGQGPATSTSVNSAQAPDGTVTASNVNVTSGAGGVRYYSIIPAGTYTISVYVRSVSGSIDFAIDFENLYSTSFTLSSTWQRVTATVTFAVTRSWIDFQINAPGVFEIWGAQLEQRSQVTAYTPTTTQPITNYIPVLQTALAGVPRFNHNPVTGESLGLLVEEQRTNLLLRSSAFDNTVWSKVSAGFTPYVAIAPDGELTATKIFASAGGSIGSSYILQGLSKAASAATYTASVYAKRAGNDRISLLIFSDTTANRASVIVSLVDGSVAVAPQVFGNFTAASVTVTTSGNGWFRVALTATSDTWNEIKHRINLSDSLQTVGDGYSGIYIWGAQLEVGTFPTSYIKTEASQATRAADSASMTGANFSSWYRQDEGTIFVEAEVPGAPSGTNYEFFNIGDGSAAGTNSILSRVNNGTTRVMSYGAYQGVAQFTLSDSKVFPEKSFAKVSLSYKTNEVSASVSAGAPLTDTSVNPPVVNSLYLGGYAQRLNGHVKRFTFYPKAFPNNIQALTA